jgi:hypothetical protein
LATGNRFLKQCWPALSLALVTLMLAATQPRACTRRIDFPAQPGNSGNRPSAHLLNGKSDSKERTTAFNRQETVVRFFRLVNQSGAQIKIRVLADGRELFVRRMKAKVDDSSGIVHPAPVEYPTLELKISMNKDVKLLSVEESQHLKKRKTFAVSDSPGKQDAGFQIVVSKEKIVVTDDYYPVR